MQTNLILPSKRIDSSGIRDHLCDIRRGVRVTSGTSGCSVVRAGAATRTRPRPAECCRTQPSAAERGRAQREAGGRASDERHRVCMERAPVRAERSLFEKVEFFVYVRSSKNRFSGYTRVPRIAR